jgi:hypothetical protein
VVGVEIMTEEELLEMLKQLVQEVDYDIYKDMFVHGDCPEGVEALINIAKQYIEVRKS